MAVGRITIPFDTGVGTQNLNYEWGTLALDHADWLRCVLELTKTETDAGDTANFYVQRRGPNGQWSDVIAFTQKIGSESGSVSTPEVLEANLQQAGTLSDTEETNEPSGSLGGSHLTAGTVRNGPFPGVYTDLTSKQRAASWRLRIEVVDSDNDADFEGNFYAEWNEAIA